MLFNQEKCGNGDEVAEDFCKEPFIDPALSKLIFLAY